MKSDMYYLCQAIDQWCKSNRFNKDLPITASWVLAMMLNANALKEKHRKEIESAPEPTA